MNMFTEGLREMGVERMWRRSFGCVLVALALVMATGGVAVADTAKPPGANPRNTQAKTSAQRSAEADPNNMVFSGVFGTTGISSYGELISDGGTAGFESPYGYEHLAVGFYGEGYALGYTKGEESRWDYSMFAERSYGITPLRHTVLKDDWNVGVAQVDTTQGNGDLRISQRFTVWKLTGRVDIEMVLTNTSGTTLTNAVLKRTSDLDVDTGGSRGWAGYMNYFGKTSDSVYAWNSAPPVGYEGHKIMMTGLSPKPSKTAIDNWNDWYSSATEDDMPFGSYGDYTATLHWNLGTLAPGQSKTVSMRYSNANAFRGEAAGQKPIMVLVSGWGAEEDPLDAGKVRDSEWLFLGTSKTVRQYVDGVLLVPAFRGKPGFFTDWWGYGDYCLDSLATPETNARHLAKLLGEMSEFDGRSIILVGHSQGGMISRAFAGNADLVRQSGVNVQGIIQLGTPNKGSKVADEYVAGNLKFPTLVGMFGGFAPSDAASTKALRTSDSSKFNDAYRNPEGFPIWRFGGTVYPLNYTPSKWMYEKWFSEKNHEIFGDTKNDLVVSKDSLTGDTSRVFFGTTPSFASLKHIKSIPANAPSVIPHGTTYDDGPSTQDGKTNAVYTWIIERLKTGLRRSGSGASSLEGKTKTSGVRSTEDADPVITTHTLPSKSLTVAPGMTEVATYRISAQTDIEVLASGDFEMRIVDPGNTVVATDTSAEAVAPGVFSTTLSVTPPVGGVYSVRIKAPAAAAQNLECYLEGNEAKEFSFADYPSEPMAAGASGAVSVRITKAASGAPVTASLVSATFNDGSAPFTLLDNGEGYDIAAGDGVFAGTVTAPNVGGDYALTLQAVGSDFEREVRVPVSVTEGWAEFAGTYESRAVYGGDGLVERVELDCGISVQTPGEYAVSVLLRDGTGALLGRADWSGPLDSGDSTVTVSPATDDLWRNSLGESGMLYFGDATLSHIGESVLVADNVASGVAVLGPLSKSDYSVRVISLEPPASNPTSQTAVTLAGTGVAQGDTITDIQFDIDGEGTWQSAIAADGSFDSADEDFEIALTGLVDGRHSVAARMLTAGGYLSAQADYAGANFVVDTQAPDAAGSLLAGRFPGASDTTAVVSVPAVDASGDESAAVGFDWRVGTAPIERRLSGESTATIDGLKPGLNTLRIRPYDDAGNSGVWIDVPVWAGVRPAPEELALASPAANTIAMSWAEPDPIAIDVVGYEYLIRRADDSALIVDWTALPALPLSASVESLGLTESETYEVSLRAVLSDGSRSGADSAAIHLFYDDGILEDTTPPVTLSDAKATYSETARIRLSPSDDKSGVAQTLWWLDGAESETTSSTIVDVDEPGHHTLSFYSVDKAGHAEETNVVAFDVITIDVAPPSTSISGIPQSWSRAPVTFALHATDNRSATCASFYRIGSAAPKPYSAPVQIAAEGETTVAYWSVDGAGNAESARLAIARIDRTAPSILVPRVSGTAPFEIVTSDGLSGVASVAYRIDGGSWVQGSWANVSTPGVHTLTVSATDLAGNVAESSAVVSVLGRSRISANASALTPKYAAPVAVTGVLRGGDNGELTLVGESVTLQALVGTTWVNVATEDAGPDSSVQFSVSPKVATTYRLAFNGTPGMYEGCTSSAVTITPCVSLGTPVAPKTMKAKKGYTVYGSLKPKHTSGTKPVRIYKYKKVSGKWKSYGYVKATAWNYSTYTRYKVKMSLPSKGSWRLRAHAPADSKHAATWSGKYDYVTVK